MVSTYKKKENTIYIRQENLYNGLILNQNELHKRAREVFESGHIKAMVYELKASDITPNWIVGKMDEFGIKRNDMVKQIGFDKSLLSLFLSGERGMTKSVKATFFYYFLSYELNRDLRV